MGNTSFWRNIGVATTDFPLSTKLVAKYKKELGDDSPDLKFIVFTLNKKIIEQEEIKKHLDIIDEIKKYNLNYNDFISAIRTFFLNYKNDIQSSRQNCCLITSRGKRVRKRKSLLPEPKIGMNLRRLDHRRPGRCRIVELNEKVGTVEWYPSKRRTKIAIWNLRKPCLFSVINKLKK